MPRARHIVEWHVDEPADREYPLRGCGLREPGHDLAADDVRGAGLRRAFDDRWRMPRQSGGRHEQLPHPAA